MPSFRKGCTSIAVLPRIIRASCLNRSLSRTAQAAPVNLDDASVFEIARAHPFVLFSTSQHAKAACVQRNSHIFVYNLWITALDSRRARQKSRIAANCPNSLRTKLRIFYYLESVELIDAGHEQDRFESRARAANSSCKKITRRPRQKNSCMNCRQSKPRLGRASTLTL